MVSIEVAMKLLKYNARFSKENNDNVKSWMMVNDVIQENMTPEIRERWMKRGYEGLNECALEYFGINRIYRDEQQSTTFEFTEQQWTWFILRWL
jgi:hypothetical protein